MPTSLVIVKSLIPFAISATSSNSSGTRSCLTNSLASSSFKALTLSFSCFSHSALRFRHSPSLSLRWRLAENFSDCLARLLCPRYKFGIQSGLNRSQRLAALPLTKCLPHTLSFSKIFSDRSSLLIAASQSLRRSIDNCSISFPWFVMTFGTRQNDRSLHRSLLFPHPTIKQNDGMIPISGFENRLSSSACLFWCYMCYFKL